MINPEAISDKPLIRTIPRGSCPLCGKDGGVLFQSLTDRLFGAPGVWSIRHCQSVQCGLLWLDPVPIPEDMPRLYESYFTHVATPKGSGLRASLEQILKQGAIQSRLGYMQGLSPWVARMLSWAADLTPSGVDGFLAEAMFLPAPRSRGRLLEIGCGNGAALAHMRDLGWSVLGTDFDPQAVAAARQLGLEVRLGGAECISKEDGPFDAIYLGHVIEHILDPAGLFRECQSLLSVGGRIVLLTPNAAGLGLKWFGRNWRGLESPRHLHLFNPTSIDLLCHQTGFHEFTVQTTARGSRYILGMSSILAGNTCANIGGIPVSLKMKIFTLFMQIFERIMIKFKPHIGEEMIVHIYNQALKNIQ